MRQRRIAPHPHGNAQAMVLAMACVTLKPLKPLNADPGVTAPLLTDAATLPEQWLGRVRQLPTEWSYQRQQQYRA